MDWNEGPSNTLKMYGGSIENNYAEFGGGVFLARDKIIMKGGSIKNNTAHYGGGVYMYGGVLELSGSGTIANNTADNDGGGVCTISERPYSSFRRSSIIMTGGSIEKNKAVSGDGGAVFLELGGMSMEGGIIANNTAGHDGGGVYNSEDFYMDDGTIKNNTAGHDGGGVYNKESTLLRMTGGTITGNTAGNNGGGVHNGWTVFMYGGTIVNNTATAGYGGGVYNAYEFAMFTKDYDYTYVYDIRGKVVPGSTGSIRNNNAPSNPAKPNFYNEGYRTPISGYYGGFFKDDYYRTIRKDDEW